MAAQYATGLEACDLALNIAPDDPKALYRKGTAALHASTSVVAAWCDRWLPFAGICLWKRGRLIAAERALAAVLELSVTGVWTATLLHQPSGQQNMTYEAPGQAARRKQRRVHAQKSDGRVAKRRPATVASARVSLAAKSCRLTGTQSRPPYNMGRPTRRWCQTCRSRWTPCGSCRMILSLCVALVCFNQMPSYGHAPLLSQVSLL